MTGRRPNPSLVPGPPPQFLFGALSSTSVWGYRGREVSVTKKKPKDYAACWDSLEGERRCTYASDEQGALANARHVLDLEALGATWQEAEYGVQMALDHLVDQTTEPVSRGRLARHLEVLYQVPVDEYRIRREQMDAFYALSLAERLRLLEAVIDFQARAGQFEPKRRAPNPDPLGARFELLML